MPLLAREGDRPVHELRDGQAVQRVPAPVGGGIGELRGRASTLLDGVGSGRRNRARSTIEPDARS